MKLAYWNKNFTLKFVSLYINGINSPAKAGKWKQYLMVTACVFILLLLFMSCKTCDCPAYT